MDSKTNYVSATERIGQADTLTRLAQIELGIDRVYDAGQLTLSEYTRLSIKIMDKWVELEAILGRDV